MASLLIADWTTPKILAGIFRVPALRIASVTNSLSLFRVGDDVVESVGVTLDGEVKPPPSGDPGLPEVTRLEAHAHYEALTFFFLGASSALITSFAGENGP